MYQQESGELNTSEYDFIERIAKLDNILFWTRNDSRKDFYLNGAINHYPDFLVYTQKGSVIALETKGNHLDGTDSQLKTELGEYWEKLAGNQFKYMMIFEHHANLKSAYNRHDAINLIKKL